MWWGRGELDTELKKSALVPQTSWKKKGTDYGTYIETIKHTEKRKEGRKSGQKG